MRTQFNRRRPITAAIGGLILCSAGLAQSADGGVQDTFYRAYYLEHEAGDYAGAAALYEKVAATSSAPERIVEEAHARLAVCREEVTATDLAALMPRSPLAYIELNRPGGQLKQILTDLGLMGGDGREFAGKHLHISPELIDGLVGLRGAAIAVTGFNMNTEQPMGLVVLHPGELDIVRGLLETALPASAEKVADIGGYPTWSVEGQAYVTLTERLVLASPGKREIKKAVGRLQGEGRAGDNLLENTVLTEALEGRGEDLVYFCLNTQPIVKLGELALEASGEQINQAELAMAMEVLDPGSLQSISGSLGYGQHGLEVDVAMRLDDDHRNLAYNLLRNPSVERRTLECVPQGTALFAAVGANPMRPYQSHEPEVVSANDLGRELFSNLASLAVFAMPTQSAGSGPMPMPDVGIVMTVNDPAKSDSLWTTLLGIGCMATGTSPTGGKDLMVAGVEAHSYAFPEGIEIYYAMHDHEIVVGATQSALESALRARQTGLSVLNDPSYRSGVAHMDGGTTTAVFVHPGRVITAGMPFMSSFERQQASQIAPLLESTVVCACLHHSTAKLEVCTLISGLPEIDGMLAQALENGFYNTAPYAYESVDASPEYAYTDAATAEQLQSLGYLSADIEPVEATIVEEYPDVIGIGGGGPVTGAEAIAQLRMNLAKGESVMASHLLESYAKVQWNDANGLNEVAWPLVSEADLVGKFTDLAAKLSERSNELAEYNNWYYVDTLAHVRAEQGRLEEAIKLQNHAVELASGDGRAHEAEAALKKFEALLGQDH